VAVTACNQVPLSMRMRTQGILDVGVELVVRLQRLPQVFLDKSRRAGPSVACANSGSSFTLTF